MLTKVPVQVERVRRAPERPSSALEILAGRILAFCAHPFAAWRVLPPSGRALIVSGYLAAGYVTVLAALLIL